MTTNLTTDVFDFLNKYEEFCSKAFHNQVYKHFIKYNATGSEETYAKILSNLNITTDCIECYGGEGEGERYWSVWEFCRGDEKVFVKFDGWYQSYVGSEFDEWFFVEPVQVMVTQYQRVKNESKD